MDIEILQPYQFESKNVNPKIRWTELRHNGVQFPDDYVPLPNNIKILYNGKPIDLDKYDTNNELYLTAEECAVFFAKQILSDQRNKNNYAVDPIFRNNFFNSWRKVLKYKHEQLTDFDKFDFTPLVDFLDKQIKAEKSIKKSASKAEKESSKEEKQGNKQLYGYALVDGELFDLGNSMVEMPTIFIGHSSPLRGTIKPRIQPSDITLNISTKFVPKCYSKGKDCRWGAVVEDRTSTWIASWRDRLTEKIKYVWLNRSVSKWVLENDMLKFDKARRLNKYIDQIRAKYNADLSSPILVKQQFGLATYFLDILSIRPGEDKDEEMEADTVGLTTLKTSNIKLLPDNKVEFDFYGKSSIQFLKTVQLSPIAYTVLTRLVKSKKDKIFDLDAERLNDYLKTLHSELPDLTAKVFRTWKASTTLEKALFDLGRPQPELSELRKKHLLNQACGKVAEELNHRRSVDMEKQTAKIKEKIDKLTAKKITAVTEEKIDNLKQSLEQYSISTMTSKQNYNDPRIFVVWAKRWQMPIEKIYSKELLKKFNWSLKTKTDWRF